MNVALFAVRCFMDERIATLLEDLKRAPSLEGAEVRRAARRAAWVAEFTPQQFEEFLTAIRALPPPLSSPADRSLAEWLDAAVQARRKGLTTAVKLAVAEETYRALGKGSRARARLLAWLATSANAVEIDLLGRLLVDDPPEEDQDVVQSLAPLFQQGRKQAAALFPRALGALAHPAIAAPIVDLANFLTREKLVARHPAADRAADLSALLGELAQSLVRLEERPDEHGDSPEQLSRRVARSVALAVSLCDALALIGDKQAIGKLHQALSVRHRRVRTEAAAALARFGDEQGVSELVQLASEPVARLRVLAYADELGLREKIDPSFATAEARAEAELCVWLAEPTQYGLPPTSCELVDHRRQHWPGYAEPIDCFLFRFQYLVTIEGQGERSFSNIGIAGPLAHAFVADLGDLPPDDIYAAFAGWQAQHEEIREFNVERLSKSEQLEVERLKRRLHDAGFAQIEPQRMGYFFGDKALVALAQRQGAAGVAVTDFQDTLFFPRRHARPLGPDEAYCIYKGRKLLATFNRGAVSGE
jgi:hypothetical protein